MSILIIMGITITFHIIFLILIVGIITNTISIKKGLAIMTTICHHYLFRLDGHRRRQIGTLTPGRRERKGKEEIEKEGERERKKRRGKK